MENHHLSRRADNVKSETSDVIDDLIREVEELEEKNSSLTNDVEKLENRIQELEEIISEKDNEILELNVGDSLRNN